MSCVLGATVLLKEEMAVYRILNWHSDRLMDREGQTSLPQVLAVSLELRLSLLL